MIWMGQAAASGRLSRNRLAGIRIPSTMASEEAWRAAHIRARVPIVSSGYAAFACAIFALLPVSMPAVMTGISVGCAVMVGLVLYGAVVGSRAARAVALRQESASEMQE